MCTLFFFQNPVGRITLLSPFALTKFRVFPLKKVVLQVFQFQISFFCNDYFLAPIAHPLQLNNPHLFKNPPGDATPSLCKFYKLQFHLLCAHLRSCTNRCISGCYVWDVRMLITGLPLNVGGKHPDEENMNLSTLELSRAASD
jgi:hypothetical protein